MKSCLMILQPREIAEAIASLKSIPVDKVWFRGFKEIGLEVHLNKFIQNTNYDAYFIICDDGVVDTKCFRLVENLLKDNKEVVATGYCRLAKEDPLVNLTKKSIGGNGYDIWWEHYDFYTYDEVVAMTEVFKTGYTGWVFTGMTREMWLRFPFLVNRRTLMQSDAMTSIRLAAHGIPILAHPQAYIEHLKSNKEQTYNKNWIDTKSIVVEWA